MVEDSDGIPADALVDIAYLAKSVNRVRLLTALASGSYSRRELDERTGIARSTIGRIINEFEKLGWIERTSDGTYTATATAQLIVAEFTELVETMDTIRMLGDAAAWIPVEELSIGVQHFNDATTRQSGPNAPFELVEYLADLIRDATTFQVLTFLAPPSPVGQVMHAGVIEGRLRAEHVLAGGLVRYLRDQQHHPPYWRDYIEAGAEVYRYEGRIPCNLFIVDETVLLMNDQPEGGGAAIETENGTVHAGVYELFETYREDATQIDADVFA